MPLVAENSSNIRLPEPEDVKLGTTGPQDIVVEHADESADRPEYDSSGNTIKIEHADGEVTISLDGKPVESAEKNEKADAWFKNLAEDIEAGDLNIIANDLLRAIDGDLGSRKDWTEARTQGLKLLGLKIELPGVESAADGAPVEGMSKVRHPLLLEAVLRFQANARSELLPTDGPVKVRNDSNASSIQEDQLANALERDLNHYLTAVATEYYPDTDRMLLMLGFGGTSFKKVYGCPLRGRPVSESVDADDLIVNQATTDLANARRITHRVSLRPSTVKRMQIIGEWLDVELGTPLAKKTDPLTAEEAAQQGIDPDAATPEDRDREIYECYCELDLKGYEHKHKGANSGLEIPYRVTIDVSSKRILSIVRNYHKPEGKKLPVAIRRFVKYTFVPGIGFYDIGLLNILGNTTNAITAAWREMLDSGMYANFPGFLMADTGARQNTNIFRVPPGGGALVKTGGLPINQAVMALPYKDPSMALMQLVDNMATTGMRIGGTSEQQVGEGRAETPVGTTLALIEQAVKVMNAVHKRLHSAQAEEFKLLIECFKDNPEAFWENGQRSQVEWDKATFIKAISDNELSPQADPNTASSSQRMMKIMALKQLQASNPSMYDPIAIDTAALQAIGFSNPQQFFVPPSAMGQPPPELQEKQAEIANKTKVADAQVALAKARMSEVDAKIKQGAFMPKQGLAGGERPESEEAKHLQIAEAHAKIQDSSTRAMDAETRRHSLNIELHEREDEAQNRAQDRANDAQDRASREKIAILGLAKDIMLHPGNAGATDKALGPMKKAIGTVTPQKPKADGKEQ